MSTVKRKCQVVMLPTEKASRINSIFKRNRLEFTKTELLHNSSQHLYILSDDEIKAGDWMMFNSTSDPVQCIKVDDTTVYHSKGYYDKIGTLKIIATTDSSLSQVSRTEIPQPSQGFIQKYIDAYNSGKPIEKVMVEYEQKCSKSPCEMFSCDANPTGCNHPIFTPKINPKDNTITISKVKDSWTREEMIDFAWKTLVQGRKASTSMKDLFEDLPVWFDKWIEENL